MRTGKTAAVPRRTTKVGTDDELLLIAIALVKAAERDNPDFVSHVAVVFEALKHPANPAIAVPTSDLRLLIKFRSC